MRECSFLLLSDSARLGFVKKLSVHQKKLRVFGLVGLEKMLKVRIIFLKRILMSVVVCVMFGNAPLGAGKFPWCCSCRGDVATPVDEAYAELPADAGFEKPRPVGVQPSRRFSESGDSESSTKTPPAAPSSPVVVSPMMMPKSRMSSAVTKELSCSQIDAFIKRYLASQVYKDFYVILRNNGFFDLATTGFAPVFVRTIWEHVEKCLSYNNLPADCRTVARVMRGLFPQFLYDTSPFGVIDLRRTSTLIMFWITGSDSHERIDRVDLRTGKLQGFARYTGSFFIYPLEYSFYLRVFEMEQARFRV